LRLLLQINKTSITSCLCTDKYLNIVANTIKMLQVSLQEERMEVIA